MGSDQHNGIVADHPANACRGLRHVSDLETALAKLRHNIACTTLTATGSPTSSHDLRVTASMFALQFPR